MKGNIVVTIVMFAACTALLLGLISSKMVRKDDSSVQDLIEKARSGIRGSMLYHVNLGISAEDYVCGGFDCEGVVLVGEDWMEEGKIYGLEVRPEDGDVLVNITRRAD